MPKRIKHQLFIHMDYESSGILWVRYSYPLSEPPIGETVIRLQAKKVPAQLRKDIELVIKEFISRITVKPIRAPHAIIMPSIVLGVTTIVIQDQTRAKDLPQARLYYYEVVSKLGIQVEKELHMGPTDFAGSLQAPWQRIKAKVKGIAWKHYIGLVGSEYLKPQQQSAKKR